MSELIKNALCHQRTLIWHSLPHCALQLPLKSVLYAKLTDIPIRRSARARSRSLGREKESCLLVTMINLPASPDSLLVFALLWQVRPIRLTATGTGPCNGSPVCIPIMAPLWPEMSLDWITRVGERSAAVEPAV